MKQNEKSILERATRALQADVPDAAAISDSAARSAQVLGIDMQHEAFEGAIQNCDGVQQLLSAYRSGSLSEARALLVKAHLHDCGVCLRKYREGSGKSVLDWSAPRVATKAQRRPFAWGWALAVSSVLLISGLFVYKAYWQVPPGVRAQVQSIDGSAYLIAANGERQITAGSELREGDQLRTAGQSHAVLRLSDGSIVELNQRSALNVGARGRDMTVALDRGAVIVQAAHRSSGHLYVKTPDCRVAVTGTVFSVDAGLKGSRVAVLQGSVQVAHAGVHSTLRPGDQLATSDNLAPEPLEQQFAWSPDRAKYVGLMAQLALVEHRIAQIPFPQPRYSSDLLRRMPADTVLYISIPNLGDFLTQANTIFHDQLNQSPELQQWWSRTHKSNPEALDELVAKIHDISQYLGDEVVVVGAGQGDHSNVAIVADIQRSGLKDELRQQFSTGEHGLVVLDEASLAAMSSATAVGPQAYALVRDRELVISNNIAMLKQMNTQLSAGDSGFAGGDFGKHIAAAYTRGAGMILAANLHAMLANNMNRAPQKPRQVLETSGLSSVQYLIAEHREVNGMPANHLNLQFAGTRQRVASWLASPAPIGSLDFVSPNASVAVATLTKDPAAIADDLMAMATQAKGQSMNWNEVDSKLQVSVRDDLIANLSGDFVVALDGPVLPTPSWKVVVEVNNAARLENTLERMVQAIQNEAQDSKAHAVAIEPSTADGRTYYAIRNLTTGTVLAQYTFADGFMIIGPTRALLIDALRAHTSGNSLAHSAAFRSLLPRDENENYSAVAYQNLSPVLTPLLSQFSGESADAIRKLAADSRPTVICAWGKDNRIEAASDSRLFGFDFLTMGALLNSRNKPVGQFVHR